MHYKLELREEQFQDSINIASGLFHPIKGFMSSLDYHSVVNDMELSNGEVWTIPISLDIDYKTYINISHKQKLCLTFKNKSVGYLEVEDCYEVDVEGDTLKIFGTLDSKHPGVTKELLKSKYRVGGTIIISDLSLLDNCLKPEKTKKYFKDKGWKTIVGFQTRNPIHKAHEYLQRVALEVCDALFINPLVGWKKQGDFSEDAVTLGYEQMLKDYYNGLNVYFASLKTPMRYAGPKEAIFHAIIRRNLGCTHFIIGRDHAGVGDYYGKYEAHHLARNIIKKNKLGIELMLLNEPFHCQKCDQIVSSKTCNHEDKYKVKISGTKIREILGNDRRPSSTFMRPEVADAIIALKDKKFIKVR